MLALAVGELRGVVELGGECECGRASVLCQRECLRATGDLAGRLAVVRKVRGPPQGSTPGKGAVPRTLLEQLLDDLASLLAVAAEPRSRCQGRDGVERASGVVRRRPTHRGAEVVDLLVEEVEPLDLLRGEDVRLCGARDGEEVVGVSRGCAGSLVVDGELLVAEVPEGLEQSVAAFGGDEERLVDEVREDVDDILGGDPRRGAHGLGGRKVEGAGEDREVPEGHLLLVEEQLVAPLDGGPEGAVSVRGVAVPAGEQLEPVMQACRDLANRERLDARGGELDRQRQAIELRAHVLDVVPHALVEGEVRSDRRGTETEQSRGGFDGQRRDRLLGLAVDRQGFTAGGDQSNVGAGREHRAGDGGGRVEDVLAVVEDDDGLAVAQRGEESLEGSQRLTAVTGRPRRARSCCRPRRRRRAVRAQRARHRRVWCR